MITDLDISALRKSVADKKDRESLRLIDIRDQMGVPQGTMSRFMLGAMPDILTFARICEWLDVDPRTLYVFPTPTKKTKLRTRKGAP